jgi:hypothetical protein
MRKKQNFKVLLFLLLGIIIVSCQYEEDKTQENQAHDHVHATVTEMKYNDLFKTNNFNKAVKKIPKYKVRKTDAFGRSVMEDTFGFTIYDAPVKVTETYDKIAYTILIKSDTIVDGVYFENLVINIDKETFLTDIAKIKYNLTSDITPTNDDSFSFSSDNEIKYLVDDNIDISNKEAINGGPCLPFSMLVCNYGGSLHPAGENCGTTFTITIDPCNLLGGTSGGTSSSSGTNGTTGSTGNSSTSGDSGSTTGGGLTFGYDYTTNNNNNNTTYTGVGQTYGSGGGGGLGNPIIINPVPPCPTCPELEEEVVKKTPCESLKKIIDSPIAISKITELEGKLNQDKENGFAFQQDPNTGNLSNPIPTVSPASNSNIIKMSLYTGGNFVGAYHTHPNPQTTGVAPMFAPKDIEWLYKVARAHNIPNNQKDYSDYFLTLTTGNGTFAIKINDWIKFANFMGSKYPEFSEQLKYIYEQSSGVTGSPASVSDLTKELLKQFRDQDSGVGLFELSSNKQNWSEVVLDPTNENLTPLRNPCN